MRPLRRRLTRRRFRRVDPPGGTEAAVSPEPETEPEPAAAPPRPVRCMCGTILEISVEDHEQRKSCGTCRRRFEVQASYDTAAGRNELQIHYLTEQNQRTGETCVIGSSTTVVTSKPALPGVAVEPEPPTEALYNCGCGSLLLLRKQYYEKRVRCPDCGARLLAFMLFDPATNGFSLQTFRLVDASTGQTQILPKL